MSRELLVAKKALVFLVFGLSSVSALATEYRVEATATVTRTLGTDVIFGKTEESFPIQYSFTFDDSTSTTVPSGTEVYPGYTTDSQLTLVPASSVQSFTMTIGSKVFSSADLQTKGLVTSTGAPYGLLISGQLGVSGASNKVAFEIRDYDTSVHVSDMLCSQGICTLTSSGLVTEYSTNNTGDISDIASTVTSLSLPPHEQLVQAITSLESLIIDSGIKKGLARKLGGALVKLNAGEEVNVTKLTEKLQKFIKQVSGKKGRKLTEEQKAELTAAATEVLDSL